MDIGMIGQRGVPATYGGVEHHVEQLGQRLAARGHRVTIYSRKGYSDSSLITYAGMNVHYSAVLPTKHLEAVSHSAVASAYALRARHEIIHYHSVGPGLMSPLVKLGGRSTRVVQTIHGLDADRSKWGGAASAVLRLGTWMSAHVPDTTIVVSRALQAHYLHRYGANTKYIPNGIKSMPRIEFDTESEFAYLQGTPYVLFVGRIVPEKLPHILISAFRKIKDDVRLVIAGGSSFTDAYCESIAALAARDSRIVLTGYVYGDSLASLYSNAAAFVLPSAVEGLPLSLLEAASYGVPVIASDIAPHREILGTPQSGRWLVDVGDVDGLAKRLEAVIRDTESEQAAAQEFAIDVHCAYSWDRVTDHVEQLYSELIRDQHVAERGA